MTSASSDWQRVDASGTPEDTLKAALAALKRTPEAMR